MERVPSHPVLTGAEAGGWEKARLTDETLEWSAMQTAGTRVALSILEDFKEIGGLPAGGRLLVLAGKGHNGGDALLAARAILAERPGTSVVVVLAFGAGDLRPLAGRALDWLRQQAPERVKIVPQELVLADGQEYALCVDGVYGFQVRA